MVACLLSTGGLTESDFEQAALGWLKSLGAMSPMEPTSVEPVLKWLDGAAVAENATTAADGGGAESDPSHKDLLIRLVLNLLDEESR